MTAGIMEDVSMMSAFSAFRGGSHLHTQHEPHMRCERTCALVITLCKCSQKQTAQIPKPITNKTNYETKQITKQTNYKINTITK